MKLSISTSYFSSFLPNQQNMMEMIDFSYIWLFSIANSFSCLNPTWIVMIIYQNWCIDLKFFYIFLIIFIIYLYLWCSALQKKMLSSTKRKYNIEGLTCETHISVIFSLIICMKHASCYQNILYSCLTF